MNGKIIPRRKRPIQLINPTITKAEGRKVWLKISTMTDIVAPAGEERKRGKKTIASPVLIPQPLPTFGRVEKSVSRAVEQLPGTFYEAFLVVQPILRGCFECRGEVIPKYVETGTSLITDRAPFSQLATF